MKTSWVEHQSNAEVLRKVGEGRSLLRVIARRPKNWVRHIQRGGSLLKDVMEGRYQCKRPPGREEICATRQKKAGKLMT